MSAIVIVITPVRTELVIKLGENGHPTELISDCLMEVRLARAVLGLYQ